MSKPFEIISKNNLPVPKSLIQVGASGGQELIDFVNAGIADALLIEPLDLPFSILKQQVQHIPTYIPLQVLITSSNGKKFDFHVASNGGQSSSILEPGDHLNNYPDVQFSDKIELTGYRLDSIFSYVRSQKIINFEKIDMLYIDVQGAELFVLKGAGELLESINYVWTEIGTGKGYVGAASYLDIIKYLDFYGFQLVYLECELDRFGDAFFVNSRNLSV